MGMEGVMDERLEREMSMRDSVGVKETKTAMHAWCLCMSGEMGMAGMKKMRMDKEEGGDGYEKVGSGYEENGYEMEMAICMRLHASGNDENERVGDERHEEIG